MHVRCATAQRCACVRPATVCRHDALACRALARFSRELPVNIYTHTHVYARGESDRAHRVCVRWMLFAFVRVCTCKAAMCARVLESAGHHTAHFLSARKRGDARLACLRSGETVGTKDRCNSDFRAFFCVCVSLLRGKDATGAPGWMTCARGVIAGARVLVVIKFEYLVGFFLYCLLAC